MRRCTQQCAMHRQHYKTVIMGGGPMGNSIALHLSQMIKKANADASILVVERDQTYKYNSAMLSCGGIRQQFSLKENIFLSTYGAQFVKSFKELKFDEYGYLFLFDEKNRNVMEHNHGEQLKCGADWIEALDATKLSSKFPWLSLTNDDDRDRDIVVGTFGNKNEGFIDPWQFTMLMKEQALALGVEFVEGDVVDGTITCDSSSGSTYTLESIQFKSKEEEKTLTADTFVNAAGAGAGILFDKFIKELPIVRLPVAPKKRCVFQIHCPDGPPPNTPLVVDPSGVYFRPDSRPGYFLCGISPPKELDPDFEAYNELIKGDSDSSGGKYKVKLEVEQSDHSQLFEEIIWPVLYRMCPAFEKLKVTSSWAGLYEVNTLDENAIIGYHSQVQNLMLCNGFSGHGLQQSPGAGRAVAEQLMNAENSIDLSRLSFNRVQKNEPLFEFGIV